LQSELIKNGAAVLVMILVVVASLIVGRKLLAPGPERLDAVVAEPLTPHLTTAAAGAGAPDSSRSPIPETQRTATTADRLRQRAAERAEEVARQLQSWMSE